MAKSLTSLLFQAARLSADGRALRKGPTAAAKRVVRKQVYKNVNAPLATILRRILK